MSEMNETARGFEPAKYFLNLKGKQYLPIAARIAWFREKCPIESGWAIHTQRVAGGRDEGYATYRACIRDPEGKVIATGTKTEDKQGFPDFEEKSETGSIGRALALCGFGTLFAQELDEGTERIVDSPQPARDARPRVQTGEGVAHARHEPGTETREGAPVECKCEDCGKEMTLAQVTLSRKHFGAAVCPQCQGKRR